MLLYVYMFRINVSVVKPVHRTLCNLVVSRPIEDVVSFTDLGVWAVSNNDVAGSFKHS